MVMQDAKTLDWAPGEYEEKRAALRNTVVGNSEVWKGDEESWGMAGKDHSTQHPGAREDETDALFHKKGWNRVDSGFRLWGDFPITGTREISFTDEEEGHHEMLKKKKPFGDDFLKSKGWNELDSGFRFF
mmetsp:Transcript_24426/g.55741  ORF Transcript_24426/g.55741 Transcript_24426/m.55741 type:complete len:130 (-) Transcript_24426:69-458(-)